MKFSRLEKTVLLFSYRNQEFNSIDFFNQIYSLDLSNIKSENVIIKTVDKIEIDLYHTMDTIINKFIEKQLFFSTEDKYTQWHSYKLSNKGKLLANLLKNRKCNEEI